MQLGVVAHREAGLQGAELVPSLDLRRGQGHRRTAANAMKGDLLGRIRRQLEVLQLDRQGW